MSNATEVLYPGEHYSSEDFKIVRVGRHVRGLRIQQSTWDAHVAIVGLLGGNLMNMTRAQMERERRGMKDALWRAREKLIGIGLPDEAIRVYVPFKLTPTQGGLVVLYGLETAPPRVGPYMWGKEPRIQPAVTPEIEASLNMVYDLKARDEDEKHKGEDAVECEVEVSVWDDKHNKSKVSAFSGMKVTLAVGRNGIKEVGGELTALKAKIETLDLPKKLRTDAIQKIEIALKAEAILELENATAQSVFKEWQAKLKLSLSMDLKIPGTKLKLPIEIEPYIDQAGKPGMEFKIKILDW